MDLLETNRIQLNKCIYIILIHLIKTYFKPSTTRFLIVLISFENLLTSSALEKDVIVSGL